MAFTNLVAAATTRKDGVVSTGIETAVNNQLVGVLNRNIIGVDIVARDKARKQGKELDVQVSHDAVGDVVLTDPFELITFVGSTLQDASDAAATWRAANPGFFHAVPFVKYINELGPSNKPFIVFQFYCQDPNGVTNWKINNPCVVGVTPPAAPNNSIQFNNGGAFGGDAAMTYDAVNKTVQLDQPNNVGNWMEWSGPGNTWEWQRDFEVLRLFAGTRWVDFNQNTGRIAFGPNHEVEVESATPATNSTTGALQVVGGISSQEKIFVGDLISGFGWQSERLEAGHIGIGSAAAFNIDGNGSAAVAARIRAINSVPGPSPLRGMAIDINQSGVDDGLTSVVYGIDAIVYHGGGAGVNGYGVRASLRNGLTTGVGSVGYAIYGDASTFGPGSFETRWAGYFVGNVRVFDPTDALLELATNSGGDSELRFTETPGSSLGQMSIVYRGASNRLEIGKVNPVYLDRDTGDATFQGDVSVTHAGTTTVQILSTDIGGDAVLELGEFSTVWSTIAYRGATDQLEIGNTNPITIARGNGDTLIQSTTPSTNSTTGSLVTGGGLGVAGAINVGDTSNPTGTSPVTGGSIATLGGISAQGAVWVEQEIAGNAGMRCANGFTAGSAPGIIFPGPTATLGSSAIQYGIGGGLAGGFAINDGVNTFFTASTDNNVGAFHQSIIGQFAQFVAGIRYGGFLTAQDISGGNLLLTRATSHVEVTTGHATNQVRAWASPNVGDMISVRNSTGANLNVADSAGAALELSPIANGVAQTWLWNGTAWRAF